MRMRDLMTTDVETIGPLDSVADARQRLSLHRIHHLVVVERSEILGVVSSRDLKGARAETSITDVMSSQVITADADTTVRRAANVLRGHTIGCLPILDGRKLVGIVTISDLLSLLGTGAQRPVEQGKRWTLKHRGPRRVQERRAARAK